MRRSATWDTRASARASGAHRRCSMQLGGLGLTFVVGADRIDVLSPQEECHGG